MFQRLRSPSRNAIRAALTSLALACGAAALPALANPVSDPSPPATSRFTTDAQVRAGMLAIRQKMVAQEAAIASKQLAAQDYVALAQAIEADMQAHLAQRSLPKSAAVAFNGSIWQDLAYCVGLMRNGRSVAVQHSGALGVQQVLRNYPQYFAHPGW